MTCPDVAVSSICPTSFSLGLDSACRQSVNPPALPPALQPPRLLTLLRALGRVIEGAGGIPSSETSATKRSPNAASVTALAVTLGALKRVALTARCYSQFMVPSMRRDAWHAALASEPRRRVLALLTDSSGPLDVATVAAGIGLHVTTARFHLEQLELAGLVARQINRAGGRGRPQVLFSAVATPVPVEEAQHQLTQALAAVISQDDDGGRARSVRAGEVWSTRFTAEADAAPADGPGAGGPVSDAPASSAPAAELAPPLLDVLTEIGFEPELRAEENTIALTACPFRAEARANPDVVCSVHLGLIKGIARSLGHDADDIRLTPFVTPTLCLVHLKPAN